MAISSSLQFFTPSLNHQTPFFAPTLSLSLLFLHFRFSLALLFFGCTCTPLCGDLRELALVQAEDGHVGLLVSHILVGKVKQHAAEQTEGGVPPRVHQPVGEWSGHCVDEMMNDGGNGMGYYREHGEVRERW